MSLEKSLKKLSLNLLEKIVSLLKKKVSKVVRSVILKNRLLSSY